MVCDMQELCVAFFLHLDSECLFASGICIKNGVEGLPRLLVNADGKPERRSFKIVQRQFGFLSRQMPMGGIPKDHSKRPVDFHAQESDKKPRR